MLKGNDKELYDYTMKMMENITSHYLTTDFDKGTDVNKLIEHGVARKIAAIMPDKYTEVEVTVAEVGKNLYVTATYSVEGEAEIVAIHKETLSEYEAYNPYSITKDFFFGHPRPSAGTARGKLDTLLNEKVSLGVSCRGTDSKALKTKEYPQYDENGNYDPRCMTEDFISVWGDTTTTGRGSKVETLPSGQGLGTVDDDLSYFRSKLMTGLKRTINPPYTKEKFDAARKAEEVSIKPPTSWAPMTAKSSAPVTAKPTIDFKSISQLSAPVGRELTRYETGVHVGIDLAKVDVEQELVTAMSKEIVQEIDKQIMNDLMSAAKDMTSTATEKTLGEWAVPTFGWTEETTDWNNVDITWATTCGTMPPISNNPFGVLTTDNTAPVWYNPNGSMMEEISFTEDELDELIELINTSESKVMEFA